MFVSRSIETDHKDLIHDVAFDFYGERLASCSSDQIVKVWDLGPDRQWECTSSWKTHSGSVWKVTWAHPEFGQILATCSFDRTVIIWEELGPEGTGGERTQSQWVKKTSFVDSRTPVTDIKFAPKHLGLQLASCSADGFIRVYEAPDVMNLHQWSLQHEIPCKITCSCLSWNFCRQYPPLIAVGSDDPNPASGMKVLLYEYNENCRRWLRVDAVPVMEPVYDISFAPEMARSFHYLAIASKNVQIFKLLRPVADPNAVLTETAEPKFEIKEAGQFHHHNAQVWRVSWNITGTILASSGEDGAVRLWKANYLDKWKCVAVLKGDGSTEPSEMNKALSGDTNAADLLGALSTMHFYKLTNSLPQSSDMAIN